MKKREERDRGRQGRGRREEGRGKGGREGEGRLQWHTTIFAAVGKLR